MCLGNKSIAEGKNWKVMQVEHIDKFNIIEGCSPLRPRIEGTALKNRQVHEKKRNELHHEIHSDQKVQIRL